MRIEDSDLYLHELFDLEVVNMGLNARLYLSLFLIDDHT